MTLEKQQGNKQGKLELLAEKIECKDRLVLPDGIAYCTGFVRDCPYINLKRYETLLTAEFFRCDYHRTFEGIEHEKKG
jgi:hypothetical protein